MPEPRPDLAAIRERLEIAERGSLMAGNSVVRRADLSALLARCEELEAALREIGATQSYNTAKKIARKVLAAAQEEPR